MGFAQRHRIPQPALALVQDEAVHQVKQAPVFGHPAGNLDPGDLVTGAVTKLASFGAFIGLQHEIDGLVHISQLAKERVRNVEDVLKEGDQVLVKVIGVDERGKIKLSRKEALGLPWPEKKE